MSQTTVISEGMWNFDGACAPPEDGPRNPGQWNGQETFTLGCFQYVRRGTDGNGKGLKRGKIQYRVKGLVADPAPAYAKARAFCAGKNAAASKSSA